MPSVSKKQHNFMAAVASNPKFAKKVGVPRSVGEEFLTADKGKKFKQGGEMKESKMMVKKEVDFMKKKGAPKSMIKHEMAEAGMKKGGNVKKMAAGGSAMDPRAAAMMRKRAMMGARPEQMQGRPMMGRPMPPTPAPTMPMKKGGMTKKMAEGGMPMVEKDGKQVPAFAADGKGKMAKGGKVKKMMGGGMYAKGGGIETKGKTKGTIVKMAGGGYVKSADGIAKKGKTKATMVKMAGGGMGKKYC